MSDSTYVLGVSIIGACILRRVSRLQRDFVEDVARILHHNMQEEQPGYRRKANTVVRTIFVQVMYPRCHTRCSGQDHLCPGNVPQVPH